MKREHKTDGTPCWCKPKVVKVEPQKTKTCEKCGGEIGNKVIGDEAVAYCKECKWVTY